MYFSARQLGFVILKKKKILVVIFVFETLELYILTPPYFFIK